MDFCWHKWRYESVVLDAARGGYMQRMYCSKCGKAKLRKL